MNFIAVNESRKRNGLVIHLHLKDNSFTQLKGKQSLNKVCERDQYLLTIEGARKGGISPYNTFSSTNPHPHPTPGQQPMPRFSFNCPNEPKIFQKRIPDTPLECQAQLNAKQKKKQEKNVMK